MTGSDLIIALIKHPDIANACPKRASAKYGIREDRCRYYINQERSRRMART